MTSIGERIKKRREQLGLSVDDLAKLLGKTRQPFIDMKVMK